MHNHVTFCRIWQAGLHGTQFINNLGENKVSFGRIDLWCNVELCMGSTLDVSLTISMIFAACLVFDWLCLMHF